MPREKNPAAVALGKRRYESMTAEDRAAFFAGRDRALKQRTPWERSAIARRAAMTRRLNQPWMKQDSPPAAPAQEWNRDSLAPPPAAPGSPGEPLEPIAPAPGELPPELAEIARAIDECSDDLLDSLFVAIVERPA